MKLDKKTILRIIFRALPVGALFLPLATMTLNLGALGGLLGGLLGGGVEGLGDLLGALGGGSGKSTQYNIVGLIKALFSKDNDLLIKLLQGESMAAARTWLIAAVVGLVLSILAALAGLALVAAGGKAKWLGGSSIAYAAGALGGIGMVVAFVKFGTTLAAAVMNIASTSLNIGAYILVALILFNLCHSLVDWRSTKERERLAALAAKKRKRK